LEVAGEVEVEELDLHQELQVFSRVLFDVISSQVKGEKNNKKPKRPNPIK
jgi:hypothetical protein